MRSKKYYFFVCYTFVYTLIMLAESVFYLPGAIRWGVFLTMLIGSMRRCYVSKRLFFALFKFYKHFRKRLFTCPGLQREEVGLFLMLACSKIIGALAELKFHFTRGVSCFVDRK